MDKKRSILISISIIFLTIGYQGYKYYTYYYPLGGTGAAPSEINKAEVKQGIAINNLIKSIPVQFSNFAIESYDYSKGKFRVVLNNKLGTTSEDFFSWVSMSEYKSIPIEMFQISTTN